MKFRHLKTPRLQQDTVFLFESDSTTMWHPDIHAWFFKSGKLCNQWPAGANVPSSDVHVTPKSQSIVSKEKKEKKGQSMRLLQNVSSGNDCDYRWQGPPAHKSLLTAGTTCFCATASLHSSPAIPIETTTSPDFASCFQPHDPLLDLHLIFVFCCCFFFLFKHLINLTC